ncbi:hypothetical protein A0J61_00079 [Choanephora cucurbitarum]|uniref:Uncharacterized protein n=1 Tax=Choanephora cucurbitarum TaxID=101091 RepID=A0A1C7NT40_9FUNG|nr:hypothetical protein A0J61_00079 [Choanephora cucurbitarum]
MEFFAGSENSIGIAWHQLEQLKQEILAQTGLCAYFQELAEKAGIESDGLLIAYLKAAIDPVLRRVLIYRSPTTFTEAVSVCIEVEPDLANLSQAQILSPTTIGRGSQRYHRQKPNSF